MNDRTPRAYNRLTNEEAVACLRAAGLEPLELYRNISTPWLSECQTCGRQVTPALGNIRRGHSGCKYCAGRCNDPQESIEIMRRAGLEPLEPWPGYRMPWRCKCVACEREVTPHLESVKNGHGCWYCGKGIPTQEEAAAIMRAAGLEPLVPYSSARTAWACRCLRCGQEVAPSYADVRKGWRGCRDCGYRSRAIDQDVAVALMRTAEMEPLEPYRNANTPWRCRCMKCDREGTPTYGQIQQGWGGCRWCQISGFRVADPGVVYLAIHRGYDAVKVGIANDPAIRLRNHRARGWEVLLIAPAGGETVLATEVAILGWWRNDLGLPPYLSRGEMPQSGWTETVSAAEIDLADTMNRIRRLTSAG